MAPFLLINKSMKGVHSKGGFTLVEIMITIAIIGLLASLGIPSLLKSGRNARATRFASEIKTAGHAFVRYSFEHGNYPEDKNPAEMPSGMTEYLNGFPWGEDTVIGGQWDWDYEVFGVHAGVSVNSPNLNEEQMQKIDSKIDDGDLGSGQFRSRSGGYIYILEG